MLYYVHLHPAKQVHEKFERKTNSNTAGHVEPRLVREEKEN